MMLPVHWATFNLVPSLTSSVERARSAAPPRTSQAALPAWAAGRPHRGADG
ncbi:hypothetical protein HBB16_21915 [Pseudonocardia sp. MCCB 268]|nr:hypothetical protein [Pseudonocardia cytotoxica]